MIKYPIAYFLIVLTTAGALTLSTGALGKTGDGGPSEAPLDTPTPSRSPFILSSLGQAKPLMWAGPETPYTVVYDQWEIFLFGEAGSNYSIRINGIPSHNGTLTRSWMNISFDASSIHSATIEIIQGNETFQIIGLAISHTQYTGEGPGPDGVGSGRYNIKDLKASQRNGALGATMLGVAAWVGCWFVVVWEHNRKGVTHE